MFDFTLNLGARAWIEAPDRVNAGPVFIAHRQVKQEVLHRVDAQLPK